MAIDLILDSGAFSAWTKKSSVDIVAYAQYIKDNCDHFDYCVNLDRIPGEFGRVPSSLEVEQSAQEGWDNYLFLESLDIRTKPVFHQGEQFKWLDRMVDHGIPYIGISPANDRTTSQKRQWLDQVFARLCDVNGRPVVRTHGFGVTSVPILARYPWYSADSTSWMMMGAYGKIMVPQWKHGQFVYSVRPSMVDLSTGSKSVKEAKHFNSYSPAAREHIVEYIESLGVTVQQCQESYHQRAIVNASFFRRFSQHHVIQPFRVSGGFMDQYYVETASAPRMATEQWQHVKLIYAVSLARQASVILNEMGINERLLSYYYLNQAPKDFLEVYMKHGVYKKPSTRRSLQRPA